MGDQDRSNIISSDWGDYIETRLYNTYMNLLGARNFSSWKVQGEISTSTPGVDLVARGKFILENADSASPYTGLGSGSFKL